MNKILSFRVDHRLITPGVYLSRKDGDADTYDLRFKRPNAGDYLTNLEMHSMEHMFATYVRNSEIGERVLYFGPMGCRTGFYLIVRETDGETVKRVIKETLEKIAYEATEMFGQSKIECGNYRELSLEAAKACAKRFLSEIDILSSDFRYPEK